MVKVDNCFLLVVDVQERLFPSIYMKDDLAKKLAMVIQGAQILELPVIYTEQAPEKIGRTIPEIAQHLTNSPLFKKISFSCCQDALIMQEIGKLNRQYVLIAGIETHVCVYQTARDFANLGFVVQVVADAVSSRSPQDKVIGLERIKDSGASVTSVETSLCELLGVAQGEKFKRILGLMK